MKRMLSFTLGAALALALLGPVQARVTRIVIDETQPWVAPAGAASPAIAYERVAGRAFGELDPALPGNALIQDIALAKDADGRVRYVASFVIHKPRDMSQASGLLWHDVPNRGNVPAFAAQEQALGDVMLASAWQGDNSGNTVVRARVAASSCNCRWRAASAARRSLVRCSVASSTAAGWHRSR